MNSGRRVLLGTGLAAAVCLGAWYGLKRPAGGDTVAGLFDLTLEDANGQPFALSSLRGRTLVLNFWATWCPPCIDEMPELSALHQDIAPKNGAIIGIGIDSRDKIRQFSEKGRFSYPLLVGGLEGERLNRDCGNTMAALPYTVVVNPAGRITYRRLGRIQLQKLRDAVQQAGSAAPA